MSTALTLDTQRHQSRVLSDWLGTRPGAADRAGVEVKNLNVLVSSSDNDAMKALFAPLVSPSGFAVTDRTAMSVSTVYACMSKISGAVVQLPLHQYRLDANGNRERMEPTPLWWMLNEQPDDAWTAASWKDWIVRCIGLRGDQFTQILRRGAATSGGAIAGLRPLHPEQVFVRRVAHRLVYDVQDILTGEVYTLDQDDMLHFPGFGFDGRRSMSIVQWAARTAIGNELAAADYMGRTYGEGAMPQIALTYPNKLAPDQAALLRTSFTATYTGTGARKIPLILTEGGTVKELSLTPVDLELIAARGIERRAICEAFGVPPIMIGDSEKTSSWGTGVEQITLGFVRFTLAPMLGRWEEELNRKLFRRAGMFVEFELAGLLRGDSKAEAEAFRAALGGPGSGDGWMSTNEVRRIKNLPPLAGEDNDKPFRAQRGVATPAPAPSPEPAAS